MEENKKMRFDEFGMPIPEEDDKKDITAQEMLAELVGSSNGGKCDCIATAQLSVVRTYPDGRQVTEDDITPVAMSPIKNVSVSAFSLNDDFCTLDITFDDPFNMELRDCFEMLEEYKDRMMNGNTVDEIPTIVFTFIPKKYNGRCFMSFTNPVDYCKAVGGTQADQNCMLHMLYEFPNVSFTNVDMTEEEEQDFKATLLRSEENS